MSSCDSTPEQVDVAALYRAHHTVMRRVARAELDGRDAQADEAVAVVVHGLQEAHARGRLTPKISWEAYLVVAVRKAARRVGSRETRAATREVSRDDVDTDPADTNSEDPGAALQLDRVADRQILYAGLARLSARRRSILVLRFVAGLDRAEIAMALGITVQAVGDNERQALDELRKEWADDERPT